MAERLEETAVAAELETSEQKNNLKKSKKVIMAKKKKKKETGLTQLGQIEKKYGKDSPYMKQLEMGKKKKKKK